jgi:hypothetical protein
VVTTGVAIGLAACGGDGDLSEQTLRFTDREGRMVTSVDSPPRTLTREEITPGDQVVTTRQLLDDRGDRAGTVHEVCTITDGRNEDATQACQGVVELEDGRLSFSKTAKLSEPKPPPQPVTGGTGANEGAAGAITSVGGTKVEIQLADAVASSRPLSGSARRSSAVAETAPSATPTRREE